MLIRPSRLSANPRTFVLCADDYGMTEGVSRAIVDLLALGRLTAVSCMTTRPAWRTMARELKAFEAYASIGLHLNLTLGVPLGAMPHLAPGGIYPGLSELIRRAIYSELDQGEIETEFELQFDAFEHIYGRVPDFVDGHQHVHVLPVIRTALFTVLGRRRLLSKVWVRNPADNPYRIVQRGGPRGKALTVSALAFGFGATARRVGLRTNSGFAGFSRFDRFERYGDLFLRYLYKPGPRHLVMCHPGYVDQDLIKLREPADTRPLEAMFFTSMRFDDICAAMGMRVVKEWAEI